MVLTFKWRFILSSFAILAALGISLFTRPIAVTIAMAVVGIYLVIHYVFRFRGAYRRESIFASIAPTISVMWENSISTFKNAEGTVENKEPESADLQKKHIQNMKNLYLSKLDSLQNHER